MKVPEQVKPYVTNSQAKLIKLTNFMCVWLTVLPSAGWLGTHVHAIDSSCGQGNVNEPPI